MKTQMSLTPGRGDAGEWVDAAGETSTVAERGRHVPACLARPVTQAAMVTVGVFCVYAIGACRTIYVGDSGELVAAAAMLGIPHPSGYPLYVLLGHLWLNVVPGISAALGMSLFSAICGALACGVFYGIVRRQGLSITAAMVGTGCLAFAPSFWSQATVQRVYTLNGLFVVAVLGCVLTWWRCRRHGWLIAGAFLTGVGASNHTVMAVVGVSTGVFALMVEPRLIRRPRLLLSCVGAGLAGLTPYLYLPWRSRQEPTLDWGNPETLDALIASMTRRDFWHRAWIESPWDLWTIVVDFIHGLGSELTWAGAGLAVLGAILGRRFGRPVLLPLVIMAGNLAAVALHGSRTDIFVWHRYYIPAWAMAALLVAWGTEIVAHKWRRPARLVLIVPLALLLLGWQRFDRSDFRMADDYSRQLLASLPPGAHLAASDDNILFVLIYLHFVEHVRPDIDLILQGVGGANLGSRTFNPDTDPLFFSHHPNWQIEGLEVVPVGLVYRTVRAGAPRPEPILPEPDLEGAWDPAVPKDYLARNLVGQYHFMRGVTFEARDWPRARAELERAALAAPDNDVLFYNIGLVYRRVGLLARALAAFDTAATLNPRHIPSDHPVRASDRVDELRPQIERLRALERTLRDRHNLGNDPSATTLRTLAALFETHGEPAAAYGYRLLASEAEHNEEST